MSWPYVLDSLRAELSFLSSVRGTLDGKFEKHWGTSGTQSLTLRIKSSYLEFSSSPVLHTSESLLSFAMVILEMEEHCQG